MPDSPYKDDEQRPIARVWRAAFRTIVSALAEGNFDVAGSDERISRPSALELEQLWQSVADYGEVTLIDLPDASWSTSVAMWRGGYWEWSCHELMDT